MRPGEVIPGSGPAPCAPSESTGTVRIRNVGGLAAAIGSHVPLSALSGCLRCSTTRPARLRLVAGASVRIEPGDEVEVEVTWR